LASSGQGRGRGRQFTALKGLPGCLDRYAGLTGHTRLTQSATIPLKSVSLFDILSGANQMLPAFLLVVAEFANCPDRTPINAFAAGPVSEKEAISPVVGIRARSRFNGYPGDHRTHPHGFALCGDETVAQAESS